MFFLAGFLNRSSLTFMFVTAVRVVSIVALILGIGAEIFLLVDGIKGVQHANQPSSSSPVTSSGDNSTTSFGNATLSDDVVSATVMLLKRAVESTTSSDEKSCGYIGGTDVPKSFGGVLFFSLAQFFNIVILILCLLSELSPPKIPGQHWV